MNQQTRHDTPQGRDELLGQAHAHNPNPNDPVEDPGKRDPDAPVRDPGREPRHDDPDRGPDRNPDRNPDERGR